MLNSCYYLACGASRRPVAAASCDDRPLKDSTDGAPHRPACVRSSLFTRIVARCINAMFAICISEMVDTFQIEEIVSKYRGSSQSVGCMLVL